MVGSLIRDGLRPYRPGAEPDNAPDYIWWVRLFMDGAALMCGVIAVAQRFGTHPLLPTAGLVAIAMIPWVYDILGKSTHWMALTLPTLVGVGCVIVIYPVEPMQYDVALFLLVLLAGAVGAHDKLWQAVAVTVKAATLMILLGTLGPVDGLVFLLPLLLVGLDVGVVMQYQQRQVAEQALKQAERQEQVLQEQRQQIAREVHDVIAHSMSVTMLHLTAARRSLEDDDADVAEALDALRDAEKQGRQAMTDIRHTVGLLGQKPGKTDSTPDTADVPRLVQGFRDAGLDVSLQVHGEIEKVPATNGLSVFRIVQESLANVAKHQPDARADVLLDCRVKHPRLTITNTLPRPAVSAHPGGSGIRGMRERAELIGGELFAGQRDGRWVVDLVLAHPGHDKKCGLEKIKSELLKPGAVNGTPDPMVGTP